MITNKIQHEGVLELNGFKVPCFVLEDGERVLSTTEMQRALGVIENEPGQRSSGRLEEVLSSKAVTRSLSLDFDASKFEAKVAYEGKRKRAVYPATMLPEICEIMLKVRDYAKENHVELGSRQLAVIERADILIRALAKVGIIALVDEATGYQHERERSELQKILKAYISPELMPWQPHFPDAFYQQLFRLNDWDYTVKGIKKRPGVIGKWTNKLIYEELPKGVLEVLKSKTPKSVTGNYTKRLFQGLTENVGDPHLNAQIVQITTLFRLSDNMRDMWNKFEKIRNKAAQQLDLPFQFDENGYTIDPAREEKKEDKISGFNEKLKTALNYNPKG